MPSIDCIDEIEINAPIATVFDVVSDYTNWKKWIPIYNCMFIDSEEFVTGAKVRHQYGYKPIILTDFIRQIDEIEPQKKISESYIEGDLIGKGVWHFKEQGSKTVASYHCMVKSNKSFAHLTFILMGKNAHRNVYKPLLKKLKAHCESQSS